MKPEQVLELAETKWSDSAKWWEQAAFQAIQQHHFIIITSRSDNDAYMLRCWLTKPLIDSEDGGLQSANSTMIHRFFRPDTDPSLHDHPWWFRTHLLNGGYSEQLPVSTWKLGSVLGPRISQHVHEHVAGDTIEHEATDLHSVCRLKPNTWSLVTTGPRIRKWGFHPTGSY